MGTVPSPLWFLQDSLDVPSSHDPARCVVMCPLLVSQSILVFAESRLVCCRVGFSDGNGGSDGGSDGGGGGYEYPLYRLLQ